MAQTNAQARTAWLQGMKDAYAKALVWRNLTNRNFEGDAQTAHELTLTDVTTDGLAVQETDLDTTRDPSMPNHQTSGRTQMSFTMNHRQDISLYESQIDILEGPSDVIPEIVNKAGYNLAEKVDDEFRSAALAAVPDANDGAHASGAALVYGTATDYVDANGEPTTDAAAKLIAKVYRNIGLRYTQNNFWKVNDSRFDNRRPNVIMGPEVANATNAAIDDGVMGSGAQNALAFGDPLEQGGSFLSVKGIPTSVANGIPMETVGGKAHYVIFVTNPAAITAAFRNPVQSIDPGPFVTVQSGGNTKRFDRKIGWTMDASGTYGYAVVNGQLLFKYLIRAEA